MNYIIWKGKHSRDIKGLIISELPPITKPKMRVNETVIDGVDGSIVEELGYEPYDKPLIIGLTKDAKIDEVIEFFSGSGEVLFSNEAGKYYRATIIGQIDYARLVRFRTATVVFRVQPFKYEYQERKSNLWLNERGAKNLFNPLDPTSVNVDMWLFGNSILSMTTMEDGTYEQKQTLIYNIEAEKGDLIFFTSVLMDETCYFVIQEYTDAFIQVQQVSGTYIDGINPTTRVLEKKDANNKVRLVLYTDFNVPTGERQARYKEPILTINNGNTKYEPYTPNELMNETVEVIKSYEVTNDGNYFSMPVVDIIGSGEVEVALNGNTLFRYTFPEGEDRVIIDSQKQDAYLGNVLKNRNMVGEFPVLQIGKNTFSWEGSVTKFGVSSKSRWL